jgi:hypothetical protein
MEIEAAVLGRALCVCEDTFSELRQASSDSSTQLHRQK